MVQSTQATYGDSGWVLANKGGSLEEIVSGGFGRGVVLSGSQDAELWLADMVGVSGTGLLLGGGDWVGIWLVEDVCQYTMLVISLTLLTWWERDCWLKMASQADLELFYSESCCMLLSTHTLTNACWSLDGLGAIESCLTLNLLQVPQLHLVQGMMHCHCQIQGHE